MTRVQHTRTVLFATTLLLFADTFLPWQKVSITVAGLELASATANAWHGSWGYVIGLGSTAAMLWTLARLTGHAAGSARRDGLLGTAAGLILVTAAAAKNASDSYAAFPSYLGIALAAAMAIAGGLLLYGHPEAGLPSPMSERSEAT